MKNRKVNYLVLAVGLVVVISLFCLKYRRRSSTQTLLATDGTAIQFLGLTNGTNHWNPKIPMLQQKLYELNGRSGWSWLVRPLLPGTNSISPMIVSLPGRYDLFWFEVQLGPLSLYFAGRMLDENDQEFGPVLDLTPITFAPFFIRNSGIRPIWISNSAEYKRPKGIRIYERDRPFRPVRSVEGPVPDFVNDLYLQNPIGVFQVTSRTGN
jgi:hypothetical protein